MKFSAAGGVYARKAISLKLAAESGMTISFVGVETPETATKVNPGLIKEISFASFDKLYSSVQTAIDGVRESSDLVIGRVVCIHVDENYVLPNGKLDIMKLRPLARLGYADYTSVTDVFEMRAASMIKTPIPGGYGWMSPESLKLDPTHKNL